MSDLSDADVAALLDRMADAAAAETLPRFRAAGLASENKVADGFDPVTEADRAAERAIREVLRSARPDDAILGEEEGAQDGATGLRWVIDPIDGTRAYLSGLPVWGTLIALEDCGHLRAGIIDQPFTGERFVGLARGDGPSSATHRHAGTTRPLACRGPRSLSEAILFATGPEIFSPDEARAFESLSSAVRLRRYGCDCYAYALLALGQIDLVVEAGLQIYDIAAPAAVVRAAGGVVTGWEGEAPGTKGRVVAAANAEIHAEALKRLAG